MEGDKESGGHGVLITFAILLGLYFFVPYVFVVPLYLLEQSGVFPSGKLGPFIDVAFKPVSYLYEHVPPYKALLQAQEAVLNKYLN